MSKYQSDIKVGPYCGCAAAGLREADLEAVLKELRLVPGFSVAPGGLFSGRSRTVSVRIVSNGGPIDVHVKSFGRQNPVKDLLDHMGASRARRSWLIACALRDRGIGTPRPLGFLEKWKGRGLAESFYFTEQQQGVTSFRDELIRIYSSDPVCEKLMDLLECVAEAIRGMHDSGVLHGDLGNQNILLRRDGDAAWSNVRFIDLNRARIRERVSLRERAFDISRIVLPSDFLRVFKEMYFKDVPPGEFQHWEKRFRKRFEWHTRTRPVRRPVRTIMERRAKGRGPGYPPEKEIWIWDDHSAQAIGPLMAKDRRRYMSPVSHLRVAGATARAVLPVYRRYRALLRRSFSAPVSLERRIGLAVNPEPETLDRELTLLEPFGGIPVILRFYRHQSEADWDFCARVARRLHDAGHSVSAALVQDRQSVADPGKWKAFAESVIGRIADVAEWVELGHAINRSKWGIWNLDEHAGILRCAAGLRAKYPKVQFMGPAVIDFEYPFLLGALRNVPEGFRFQALSHHLYVDRRGAPENRQGSFSALEKFALARAIAERAPQCEGRLIVSEVNWPLRGTGVYSPVGSPYESPGPRYNDPSVGEDMYADYMIRYFTLALCSGMVERVYWWRLVARGFGLVDDSDAGHWRKRRAYDALRFFVSLLGTSTFTKKLPAPEGVGLYQFECPGGKQAVLAYSYAGERQVQLPFQYAVVVDIVGNDIAGNGREIRLSGSPVYLTGITSGA